MQAGIHSTTVGEGVGPNIAERPGGVYESSGAVVLENPPSNISFEQSGVQRPGARTASARNQYAVDTRRLPPAAPGRSAVSALRKDQNSSLQSLLASKNATASRPTTRMPSLTGTHDNAINEGYDPVVPRPVPSSSSAAARAQYVSEGREAGARNQEVHPEAIDAECIGIRVEEISEKNEDLFKQLLGFGW